MLQKKITTMGQKMGRMPETWTELMNEKNRVLHWSSEILASIDDNIKSEDTFLVAYDNVRIDDKIDRWIDNNRPKWESAIAKFPLEHSRNTLKIEVTKIADDLRHKMRKDYQAAYARMKKFTKRVDALGITERKLHAKLQNLGTTEENNVKVFVAKFGPLRKTVFENLRTVEKMSFEDKRLKVAFTRKVYDIDHKYMRECAKRINNLVRDFETCFVNSS